MSYKNLLISSVHISNPNITIKRIQSNFILRIYLEYIPHNINQLTDNIDMLFTLLANNERKRIQKCISDFSWRPTKQKNNFWCISSLAQSFTNVESAPCVLRSSIYLQQSVVSDKMKVLSEISFLWYKWKLVVVRIFIFEVDWKVSLILNVTEYFYIHWINEEW